MSAVRYRRNVNAEDSLAAVTAVKRMAKADGFRVIRATAEWARSGDMPYRLPTYRVTLEVEPLA